MLLTLLEDINPEQIIGKSVEIMADTFHHDPRGWTANKVHKIMSLKTDQMKLCVLNYLKFVTAVECLRRFGPAHFPPLPWSMETFEEMVEEQMRLRPTHDEIAVRKHLGAFQRAYKILSNLPKTYPQATNPMHLLSMERKELISVPAINLIVTHLIHYFGSSWDTSTGVPYEPIQRYPITKWSFPADVIRDLNELDQEYQRTSAEQRAELERQFANSDTIVVSDRSRVPDNLLDHTQYEEEDEPDIVATYDTGYAWFRLPTNSCPLEAAAMGHCGTGQDMDDAQDQVLISLRKKRNVYIQSEGKMIELWQPTLTGSYDTVSGAVVELRGTGNSKPKAEYHPYIIDLIKKKRFRSFRTPDYRPRDTFQPLDLGRDVVMSLLNDNRELVPTEQLIFTEDYDITPGEKLPWAQELFAMRIADTAYAGMVKVAVNGTMVTVTTNKTYADVLYNTLNKNDFNANFDEDLHPFLNAFIVSPRFKTFKYYYDVAQYVIDQIHVGSSDTYGRCWEVFGSIQRHLENTGTVADIRNNMKVIDEIDHYQTRKAFAPEDARDILKLQSLLMNTIRAILIYSWFGSLKRRTELLGTLAPEIDYALIQSHPYLESRESDEKTVKLSDKVVYRFNAENIFNSTTTFWDQIETTVNCDLRLDPGEIETVEVALTEKLERMAVEPGDVHAYRAAANEFIAKLAVDGQTEREIDRALEILTKNAGLAGPRLRA